MDNDIPEINELIKQFSKLPGLGPKSAKRIILNNETNRIFSVVGGGDTVSLLNKLKAVGKFNFVSTAGGAFLEYLEGRKLPGISALNWNDRIE